MIIDLRCVLSVSSAWWHVFVLIWFLYCNIKPEIVVSSYVACCGISLSAGSMFWHPSALFGWISVAMDEPASSGLAACSNPACVRFANIPKFTTCCWMCDSARHEGHSKECSTRQRHVRTIILHSAQSCRCTALQSFCPLGGLFTDDEEEQWDDNGDWQWDENWDSVRMRIPRWRIPRWGIHAWDAWEEQWEYNGDGNGKGKGKDKGKGKAKGKGKGKDWFSLWTES